MINKYDKIKLISGNNRQTVEDEVNQFLNDLWEDGVEIHEINLLFDTTYDSFLGTIFFSYTITYYKKHI